MPAESGIVTLKAGQRVRLTRSETLNPAMACEAAKLVSTSLPDYYCIFSPSGIAVNEIIAASLGSSGTTLAQAIIALDVRADTVIGAVAGLPEKDLVSAQFADLQKLLKSVSTEAKTEIRKRLSVHSGHIPPVRGDGFYLARIALADDWFGSGLGDVLLERFERQGIDYPGFGLHVHRDNKRAITFYRRHGYQLDGPDHTDYFYMRRHSSTATKD